MPALLDKSIPIKPNERSCLYECRITHQRLNPRKNRFEHGIFLFLLDLDELPALTARLRLFGQHRSRLYRFRDEDHLRIPG